MFIVAVDLVCLQNETLLNNSADRQNNQPAFSGLLLAIITQLASLQSLLIKLTSLQTLRSCQTRSLGCGKAMARLFPFPGREEQGLATTYRATVYCSSSVLRSNPRNWPLQGNCHSSGYLLGLSTHTRKARREKGEVYNFASKVVLPLQADFVLGTADTARINVSSRFPNPSLCLG